MNCHRSLQAYFLILIYGILLLHDVVPHTHHDDIHQDYSYILSHKSHDHHEVGGIIDFLKGLIHSHSEVADAQHHELVYKTSTITLPFLSFFGQALIPNIAILDIEWPKERLHIATSEHHWHRIILQSPKSLRAPPMS